MAGKITPVLLVTANVGSIFEDPSVMLKIWTEEFLSTVARLDPKFIAVHCQEVGGKNYERSMKHVEYFVRLLMSSEELRLFDKVRVYLDEDYSSAENFTALGNFYFIHESISDVLIWDFTAMSFVPAKGKEVHSGNIEAVSTKEKSKFPQDFFPECKWSRKGFLRTRWSVSGTVFDLINIHLFHDASNFIAMETFPSVYCKNRRRALEHTLDRFHNDDYGKAPFFVFGDFNFRTDTQGVVEKLADGLNPVRLQTNKNTDHTKLQYRDESSEVILSLGKKEFSHVNHQNMFIGNDGKWLKEFDRELEAFSGRLFEFSIVFPPSYPFEEDEKGAKRYMQTRCPSWCDRVILSCTAKSLVNNLSEAGSVEYGLMGSETCMGDHKPVYLRVELLADAGTVSRCTYHNAGNESPPCFGRYYLPGNNARVPPCWSCSKSLKAPVANVFVTESPPLTLSLNTSADGGNHFLAPPHASLLHEPYTPESMETPSSSPIPVRLQRDFGAVDELSEIEDQEAQDSALSKLDHQITQLEEVEKNVASQTTSNVEVTGIENTTIHSNSLVVNESESAINSSSPQMCLLNAIKYAVEIEPTTLPDESTQIPIKSKSNPFSFSTESYNTLLNIVKAERDLNLLPSSSKKSVKRVQSASVMEVGTIGSVQPSFVLAETAKALLNRSPQQGMRECRCFSDSWRRKTVPAVPFHVRSRSRVRLISTSSAHSSTRLQSHHSSSDEDWFEEVEGGETRIVNPESDVMSNNKDCRTPVPGQNIKESFSDSCNDIFITNPQNSCNETVSVKSQNQSQICITDFKEVDLLHSNSVLIDNKELILGASKPKNNSESDQAFSSDICLKKLDSYNINDSLSTKSSSAENNLETTNEIQPLVDSTVLKTSDEINKSNLSTTIPNMELSALKCASSTAINVQDCMLTPPSATQRSSSPRRKPLRNKSKCSTSLESITLTVDSKINTNEDFLVSPEKELTMKKKKSDSKRKMHQCCVVV